MEKTEKQVIINITLPPMPITKDYAPAGGPGSADYNTNVLYFALRAWQAGVESISKGIANKKVQE